MDIKVKRFLKIYPLFAGFSMDLLFFVAINTLFLKVVKGFSSSQIVLLTTISLIACIILQIPLLSVIKKIGNSKSVRLGTFLLLCSALLITFGNNYYVVAFGKIVYMASLSFSNMLNAVLKNNLSLEGKSDEYIKYRTRAMSVYSLITMFIALISGVIFNINPYLPMYACIGCCLFSFVMCFFINDETETPKTSEISAEVNNEIVEESKKINWNSTILYIIATFAVCFAIVSSGQSESKLFIQEELYKWFSSENVALLIGLTELISRIVRLFSNMIFSKIYNVFKKSIVIYLAAALAFSMGVLTLTYFLPVVPIFKFVLMTFGYSIILFIRDPLKSCLQELILNNSHQYEQQTLLSLLDFAYKVFYAIICFAFSMILLKWDLILVIILCMAVALLGIILSLKMYRSIKNKNKSINDNL